MKEIINAKAYKILILGLHESAIEGEWQSAAIRFFSLMRKDKIEPEQFIPLTSNTDKNDSSYSFVMPFGKHKGIKITDVPDGYIVWMFENITPHEPLKTAINKEMERRGL